MTLVSEQRCPWCQDPPGDTDAVRLDPAGRPWHERCLFAAAQAGLNGDGELIDTTEAARRLGISRRRASALIVCGRLPANKLGREYRIRARDLDVVRHRHAGRPRRTS